jgi:anthranilate 1,2-dioxygenase ferredoxin subunit
VTETWTEACAVDAVPEGGKAAFLLNGWPVLVARVAGKPMAVIDRCSHAGFALLDGRLRRGAIICPAHGARFDLATGQCLGGSYGPLKIFAVEERDGVLMIAIPDDPPPAEHRPVMPV